MGIRETIQSILDQIETVQVVNNDGQTLPIYTRVWNNQTELKKQGGTYAYPTPAAFVEWQFSNGIPIGQGATSHDVTFRVMIEHTQLDAVDGTFEQDLDFTNVVNKVHQALNRFKPANCSHLYRSGVQLDYNHDNTYLAVIEYSSHFIELTGSDEDSAIVTTQTIESPTLELQENMYIGTIPDDGSGVSPTIVNGNIVPGYGLGPSIWYNGNGVPLATIGKNSDFYLDNDSGKVYKKVDGVWVYQLTLNTFGGGSFTVQIMPDNDFVAADGIAYDNQNGNQTKDITIDMSGVTKSIQIYNGQGDHHIYFAGAPVYIYGGNEIVTELLGLAVATITNVDGKLIMY
mgnify:CR=1 FL=1